MEENKALDSEKQLKWELAINLQEVDNLKPSKILKELSWKHMDGSLTINEVEKKLEEYYDKKGDRMNYGEHECDFVSARIVEILDKKQFELTSSFLKYIHRFLFQDVYDFAGELRKIDFSKHARILNNDVIVFEGSNSLNESLEYVISKELEKKYKKMDLKEVPKSLAEFSSNLWRIHPFKEGNTRTIVIFLEKYLNSLGYKIDINLFKEKSVYFRDALVRSNYSNRNLKVKENDMFLVKFFENLLFVANNDLNPRYLIVQELFEEE